jgi:hypothetical protein
MCELSTNPHNPPQLSNAPCLPAHLDASFLHFRQLLGTRLQVFYGCNRAGNLAGVPSRVRRHRDFDGSDEIIPVCRELFQLVEIIPVCREGGERELVLVLGKGRARAGAEAETDGTRADKRRERRESGGVYK